MRSWAPRPHRHLPPGSPRVTWSPPTVRWIKCRLSSGPTLGSGRARGPEEAACAWAFDFLLDGGGYGNDPWFPILLDLFQRDHISGRAGFLAAIDLCFHLLRR